jgi:hypothetical protein
MTRESRKADLMIAELALSLVALLLILQSLFFLRVAMTTAEESPDMHTSSARERRAVADPPPNPLNFSSQTKAAH